MTKFPTDRRVMDDRIRELTRSIAMNAAQAAGRAAMEEYGECAYVAPQDHMAMMYAEASKLAERKIVCSHVYPPIPIRDYDWLAYFDGEEEGAQGWGRTEAEARQDLLDNYGEDE